MNCLKCPNFWGDAPNETQCKGCNDSKSIVDVLVEMPPLFKNNEIIKKGYHLK